MGQSGVDDVITVLPAGTALLPTLTSSFWHQCHRYYILDYLHNLHHSNIIGILLFNLQKNLKKS
jgi:hypothetical protein